MHRSFCEQLECLVVCCSQPRGAFPDCRPPFGTSSARVRHEFGAQRGFGGCCTQHPGHQASVDRADRAAQQASAVAVFSLNRVVAQTVPDSGCGQPPVFIS